MNLHQYLMKNKHLEGQVFAAPVIDGNDRFLAVYFLETSLGITFTEGEKEMLTLKVSDNNEMTITFNFDWLTDGVRVCTRFAGWRKEDIDFCCSDMPWTVFFEIGFDRFKTLSEAVFAASKESIRLNLEQARKEMGDKEWPDPPSFEWMEKTCSVGCDTEECKKFNGDCRNCDFALLRCEVCDTPIKKGQYICGSHECEKDHDGKKG